MFYIYYCPTCGMEEEHTHGMLESPIFICPQDKSILKRKITGGAGIHYKGDGWSKKVKKEVIK